MPAGLLFRRAAGMENRGPFRRRNAGQFQFLEYLRRHHGNFRPVIDGSRHQLRHRADFPIGGIVFQLEREEFESEFVKFITSRLPTPVSRKSGKRRATKFESSVVMRYLIVGWFSATAEGHYTANSPGSKCEALFRP